MDNPIQPRVGCGRLLRRDSGYSGAQQIYRTVERITRSAAALIGRRASLARAKRWCPRGITRQAFSLQAAILKGSNADALLPPSLTAGSVHRSRFRARGSASTSAHALDALDMDAGFWASRGPHGHARLRGDARGRDGDRINAVPAAAGYNFILLLRWFEELLRVLSLILWHPILAAPFHLTRAAKLSSRPTNLGPFGSEP